MLLPTLHSRVLAGTDWLGYGDSAVCPPLMEGMHLQAYDNAACHAVPSGCQSGLPQVAAPACWPNRAYPGKSAVACSPGHMLHNKIH